MRCPSDVITRKIDCAREFARRLSQMLEDKVYKIVLYGSVAKGVADEHSDVDVLVVVSSVSDEVRRAVAEAAFETSLQFNEPIEYVVMSIDEYKMGLESNPFVHEVERWGVVLYQNSRSERERAMRLMRLADEYYSYSERCMR